MTAPTRVGTTRLLAPARALAAHRPGRATRRSAAAPGRQEDVGVATVLQHPRQDQAEQREDRHCQRRPQQPPGGEFDHALAAICLKAMVPASVG